MINSLNKKWKEFLFAASGFGPNFLMVIMGAYFTDAVNPAIQTNAFQAIVPGVCFIVPALFGILYPLAKAFDGIIDIPFAHLTDTLSTKWGRRRPTIAACIIPMMLSFAMCWLPIGGAERPLLNTIWIFIWALIFFSTYTLSLISFYGSLSTTCIDEPQRLRVSGYKSFFDTITYCLAYALVPVILEGAKLNIDKFMFLLLPLMLTMTIPLFLIKEGEKYGYPENAGLQPEKITIFESLRLTFKNKIFLRWLAVNCCTFFGLQMFLVGMNTLITGGMGMNGFEMAMLNTCAFAPVPVMLYLFNKLKAKKGIRFTYQTCVLAFAVAILSFFLGSLLVTGGNKPLQYIIGGVGSIIGSWGIGAFFMMPYLITAQISSVEEKLTKKNHSAMYFAGNAVATSIVGAISGGVVYEAIKMFFFSTEKGGIVYASNFNHAAEIMGVARENVFSLGATLVPFIVSATCILGFFLCFKMPRDYTPLLVARQMKELDPTLDISEIEAEAQNEPAPDKREIVFVQVGLSILSGFIFGFIWQGIVLRRVKEFATKKPCNVLRYFLCALVPFASIFVLLKMNRELAEANEKFASSRRFKVSRVLFIITGIILPILPVNFIGLAMLQSNINKMYDLEG